ncbi:MAG: MATE family efflux transporter [Caulobacterales bacterium]
MMGRAVFAETPSLLRLAVPLVIGLAASTLIGLTDTLFLAPLGAEPLAAVALTTGVLLIFYASIYGALSVVGVNVAHAFGAGDTRAIARAVRTGLVYAGILGTACALVMALGLLALPHLGQPPDVLAILPDYWLAMAALLVPFALLIVLKSLYDAIDRPWLGVAFAFLGVGLNLPLNAALIYGIGPFPALGLLGAGLASLIAESCAFLAGFLYWRSARAMRRLRVRAPITGRSLTALAGEGAPLGLLYAAETGASALAGLMLGWFGATALAANQIVGSIAGLLYMLPLGMASAVAIRIGQAQGAGNTSGLRPIGLAALAVVSAWTLASTLVLLVSGEAIARLIAPDPQTAALAAGLFVVVAAMQVMDGLQSTSLGALRGMRDYAFPAFVSIAVYWGLALPAAYGVAFGLKLGPAGIWLGFGAGLAVASVVLARRFMRLTKVGPCDSEDPSPKTS